QRMAVKPLAIDRCSLDFACSRKLHKVCCHKTREFVCSRFGQMLPIATYATAKEVWINSRVIKRHTNACQPGAFSGHANLCRAWRDQKDWGGSNIPDFLRAAPVSLHRIG